MASYWLKHNSNSLAEGPYSASQLKTMAAAGQISTEALISNDREKWTPAKQVKGLFPSPSAPAAPIPPPLPDLAPPPPPTPDAYDVQEPEPPPVPPLGTFSPVPGLPANSVQLGYAGGYGLGGYGVVGQVRNVRWFLITAIVVVALVVFSQAMSTIGQFFFIQTSRSTTFTPRSTGFRSRSAPAPSAGQIATGALTAVIGCFGRIALLGMIIYWFVWLGTIHTELRAFNAAEFQTSPGMAVGFCFIPFFNLYWIPSMMYRAADGIDRQLGGGRISPSQVLVFHILAIVPGCCLGLGLIFYAVAMMEVQKGLNELWTRYSVHGARVPAV